MKIILTLFFYFILVGCSFDNKSGIWTGTEKISKKNNNQNLEPVFEKEQAILNFIPHPLYFFLNFFL